MLNLIEIHGGLPALPDTRPKVSVLEKEAKMDTASEKLERIHQLWRELERMKPNTAESEALMEQIRALSAEYQALMDTPQKRAASK